MDIVTKYLFVSPTHYENGKLTGAHKRFIELAYSFAKTEKVTVLSHGFPKRENIDINILELQNIKLRGMPKHFIGIMETILYLEKNAIECDYAISFGPTETFSLYKCGYRSIITFFRENLIDYLSC